MKILLAVDTSTFSEAAVKAVMTQFSPQGNAVKVFHAIDWEPQLPSSYLFAQGPEAAKAVLALRNQMLREGEEHVKLVAARLHAAGFTVSAAVSPEGDPRTAILDAAEQWPADLIVVGSHGRSGLGRFFLGSVSDRVVRHAPCSVEVVRPNVLADASGV